MEAVPERNEEFGVPKNPDMDLSNNRTADPEISKLEVNHIQNVAEPSAGKPAEESGSNMKAQEEDEKKNEKNIVEIKPDVPSTPVNILESQEEKTNMGTMVDPAVDNITVNQTMKDELTPGNSIRQVEGPVALPEEKPPSSPVKEEDKREAEDVKPSPEKESPVKPRFQKKVSGSGSAADNSSVDLNLSISSFISKSKEAGSVSLQVRVLIKVVSGYVMRKY